MTRKTELTRDDIMDIDAYREIRGQKRRDIVALKKHRRLDIGPVATCYFESFDTMWWQIHEMLYIEKGGEEQIKDELAAYNPLIPNGAELTCTVMFEIDDEIRRRNFLSRLGGVEETLFLKFGAFEIHGIPEEDVDRTNAAGKASSVQFIHIPFTPDQVDAFRSGADQIIIGFSHPEYAHMTVMPDATRQALASDFKD